MRRLLIAGVAVAAIVMLVPVSDMPMRVQDGDPRVHASGKILASEDDGGFSVIWECTPGRFIWTYGMDETAVILAGHVRIKDTNGGEPFEVKAGDMVRAQGVIVDRERQQAQWRLPRYAGGSGKKVRKVAFLHRTSRLGVLLQKIKGLINGS
jgi:uncharacterized protein